MGHRNRADERPAAKAGRGEMHRRNRRLRQNVEAWSVGIIGLLAMLWLAYASAQYSVW